MRAFHSDNPKALTKTRELEVHQALQAAGLRFDYQAHLPFRSCGLESESARAFVDFVLYRPWGAIVLECDEHQHAAYPASCDVRRDFDIAASVALGSAQKLVIVRYNPDEYRVAGKTARTPKKDRHARLVQLLTELPEPAGFQRIFLFYDREAPDSELPLVAKEWPDGARAVSKAVA
jgi:hypothetical protein